METAVRDVKGCGVVPPGREGDDLVSIMPVCVCPEVKEMGSFFGFKRMK